MSVRPYPGPLFAMLLLPGMLGAQELRLAVRDAAGAAVAGAAVTVTPAAGTAAGAFTSAADADGGLALSLAAGSYTLHVVGPGFEATDARVSVPPYPALPTRVTLLPAMRGCGVCVIRREPIPLLASQLTAMLPEPHRAGRRRSHHARLPKFDPNGLDPLSRI